jgi:signal peptidase I
MSEETLSKKDSQKDGFFKELLKFTIIAFLIVVPFRLFVAQPFIVNGASMGPTFHSGEYLIVDQLSYKTFSEPKRGSVVIFRYPEDPSKFFIKRIIGLPGEILEINEDDIKITNGENPQGFFMEEEYILHEKRDFFKIELKDDEYFVMGDNRASSSDSRIWGPLKKELIVGRPIIRLFPIDKIQLLPGDHTKS